MSKDSDLRTNGSGYYDPTAYTAIKHMEHELETDKDEERFRKLLDTIFNLCELSGFHIEGRIIIKDKKTGKVWR